MICKDRTELVMGSDGADESANLNAGLLGDFIIEVADSGAEDKLEALNGESVAPVALGAVCTSLEAPNKLSGTACTEAGFLFGALAAKRSFPSVGLDSEDGFAVNPNRKSEL